MYLNTELKWHEAILDLQVNFSKKKVVYPMNKVLDLNRATTRVGCGVVHS